MIQIHNPRKKLPPQLLKGCKDLASVGNVHVRVYNTQPHRLDLSDFLFESITTLQISSCDKSSSQICSDDLPFCPSLSHVSFVKETLGSSTLIALSNAVVL